MAVYSISDLEKLSGIKAHTLRMWEKRFDIIEPKRTATNIRYYNDKDLKHILNVAILNRNGLKISQIASLSRAEIDQKAAQLANVEFSEDNLIDALTLSLIELDEYKFHSIINSNIDQNGFEKTILEVIYPLINKLSMLWMTGSIKPVHESFMTLIIRQKMIAAIEKVQMESKIHGKKFLLFLPEGERQELSLLFLHYLLVVRKQRVINIGTDISFNDLIDAREVQKFDYMATVLSENDDIILQEFIDKLDNHFPTARIIITGYQVIAQHAVPAIGISLVPSMKEAVSLVEEIAAD